MVILKVGKPSERQRPGIEENAIRRFFFFTISTTFISMHLCTPRAGDLSSDAKCHQYRPCLLWVHFHDGYRYGELYVLMSSHFYLHDSAVIAVCGEPKLDNEEGSWRTMIQVYEYCISRHLTKAFKSLSCPVVSSCTESELPTRNDLWSSPTASWKNTPMRCRHASQEEPLTSRRTSISDNDHDEAFPYSRWGLPGAVGQLILGSMSFEGSQEWPCCMLLEVSAAPVIVVPGLASFLDWRWPSYGVDNPAAVQDSVSYRSL